MAFLWPLVDLLHLRPQGHAVPDWAPISHCVRPPGFHFTPSSWWMVPPCTPPPPPTHQRPPNSEPRLPWAWATHLKPPTNNTILRQPSKGHASYGNLPWSNQPWDSIAIYLLFWCTYIVCHLLLPYAISLVSYILPSYCIGPMGEGLFHRNPVHCIGMIEIASQTPWFLLAIFAKDTIYGGQGRFDQVSVWRHSSQLPPSTIQQPFAPFGTSTGFSR